MPRFDQSFTGLCEQNFQDTLQLKQRYLDAKTKRTPKSKESKKHQDTTSLQSSVHVQQKFLKRPSEEHDGSGHDAFEPPVKLQCTTQQHGTAQHQPDGLTKFSVEIVQQLEFTTSAANSQPQQISTNVTVKALTNASVKSDVSSPKSSNPSTPASSNVRLDPTAGSNASTSSLVECVKQEPDNDFADLDQCAAALEKDGAGFGAFPDLIGEDTNDEIITSDAFKDLISDISNYPELMKDFDFDEQKNVNVNVNNEIGGGGNNGGGVMNGLKIEDSKSGIATATSNATNINNVYDNAKNANQNNQNYSPPIFDGSMVNKNNRISYSNMEFPKTELSPAAQTLKQMAEQHQHKSQIGLSFNPNNRSLNSRSPYQDFQFQGEYGSPSNQNFKNSPNFTPPDMIKQEMIFQGNEYDMKRKGAGIYKQQYSPYGSPGASSHGSPGPGYLPRSNTNSAASTGSASGGFNGGTPPRPSSGPGGGNNNNCNGGNNSTGPTLQINQAQQLHISQGQNIQVSAGQHLQLTGDIKGTVTVAAQQGLYFSQQAQSQNGPGAMGQNAQQNAQQNHHSSNTAGQQASAQQQQQQSSNMGAQPGMTNQANLGNQHTMGGMSAQQQTPTHMGQNMGNSNINQQQQNSPYSNNITNSNPGNMSGGMHNNSNVNSNSAMSNQANMSSQGGMPVSTCPGGLGLGTMGDGFSMSQSQTINFTQQTLRQRAAAANGMSNQMGPSGQVCPTPNVTNMGSRHLSPQMIEHQKLLQQQQQQQQQLLRNQQVAMQQQQMLRPPPPDYKTSATLMQGLQNRYPSSLPGIRRMPQPMPPSGPMIRPQNMYMLQQQQHMSARGIYPRQQAPMGNSEPLSQHSNAEWRQILMSQQQNANLNPQMRSNFQHQGFNMNMGNIQVSNLQQQQQMRAQQIMVSSGNMGPNQHPINQVQANQGGPLSQMTSMNQQMLNQIHQHQSMMQQNANNQLSVTNMSLQQSQSLSLSSTQSLQQSHMLQNAQNQLTNSHSSNNHSANSLGNFGSSNDFNLDFLENLSATDSGFTDQELLSSFDNDSGFNFQDIL
ncbi:neurogenic protein mastermind-like isoform X1 [Agrilus planipennis]|uniref:Neurogenic protein mastermind-like isoform X1 n=1 Tax=Agrilus planipennis TaxID=224129 RepID=A0A7F5R8I6_AGRPL|nr:neurogenic protein mastermind-like isoform X1 [Agrilus planipennis]